MTHAAPQKSGLAGEAVALRAREIELGAAALLDVFDELRTDAFPWLLDSALVDQRLGRYSFAGSDPYLVARAFGSQLSLECRRPVVPGLEVGHWRAEGDPLALVRAWLPRCSELERPPELPPELPFIGGAIGCWGYELAEQMDVVRLHGRNDLALPDLVLLFVDRLLAVDHVSRRAYAIGLGIGGDAIAAADLAADACSQLTDRVMQVASHSPADRRDRAPAARDEEGEIARRRRLLATPLPSGLRAPLDGPAYASRVRSLQAEIAAGNVYEANLTQRMEVDHDGDAWKLYRILREQSPAPFACFIELPEGSVLGSSPERFLRVDGAGSVESRPIKGTRPRGSGPEEDRDLERALLASSKDRAENLMIVDLVRNDLGRVCEIGSIRVPELMVVERYASVFQLVSSVTGRLAEGRDCLDLIAAAFPPGSMTGAPKLAAMQLLDDLEPVRRGFYSGAIGYLDVRGGLDLCVVIRTLILQKGRAYLHVGGAVVADSEPEAEYRETLDKARALLAALAAAGGGAEGLEPEAVAPADLQS